MCSYIVLICVLHVFTQVERDRQTKREDNRNQAPGTSLPCSCHTSSWLRGPCSSVLCLKASSISPSALPLLMRSALAPQGSIHVSLWILYASPFLPPAASGNPPRRFPCVLWHHDSCTLSHSSRDVSSISCTSISWASSPTNRPRGSGLPYLEVEYPGIARAKALVLGNDPGQCFLVEGQGGNGRQEPAVSCRAEVTQVSYFLQLILRNQEKAMPEGCGDMFLLC